MSKDMMPWYVPRLSMREKARRGWLKNYPWAEARITEAFAPPLAIAWRMARRRAYFMGGTPAQYMRSGNLLREAHEWRNHWLAVAREMGIRTHRQWQRHLAQQQRRHAA